MTTFAPVAPPLAVLRHVSAFHTGLAAKLPPKYSLCPVGQGTADLEAKYNTWKDDSDFSFLFVLFALMLGFN